MEMLGVRVTKVIKWGLCLEGWDDDWNRKMMLWKNLNGEKVDKNLPLLSQEENLWNTAR